MIVKNGTIRLEWDNGRTVDLGTIGIEAGKDAKIDTRGIRRLRQRLGWDLVRIGMRCMFPGRKWRTEYDHPD